MTYFQNRDFAQVLIELDGMPRYQAGPSPDGLALYVDLLGSALGPALSAQSIAADDRFVRQIRVLQTGPQTTRVIIELKVAVVPEVFPESGFGQHRLIVRWRRAPFQFREEPDNPPGEPVVAPRRPLPPGRTSIPERPAPVVEPTPAARARSVSEPIRFPGPVKTVQAVRLKTSISVDGRLDDEAWSLIPAFDDFQQRDPEEGKPASERTELRIAYDADALYVGIRLFDSKPEEIVRRRSRRDGNEESDSVALYLDPRHDHLTGFVFELSAAGVQRDAIIYNDWETDPQWDGVWSSGVKLDQLGWTAEMRIPLSQLRFSAGQGTWGINISRSITRKHEQDWLELVPKQERGLASRMADLRGLDDIEPSRHLELLPYMVTRGEFISPQPGDPFNDGSRYFGGAGLDLKWGPNSKLTADATVNPDFGQVEVDPAVINLTAYETYFQENRPFFVEGSPIFSNFGKGGSGSSRLDQILFYSRRIGLRPSGEPSAQFVDSPKATRILGAAKLTGKTAGGWSLGLLEALTGREDAQLADGDFRSRTEVEPLTNYLVGRAIREGSRAGVGFLTTSVARDTSRPESRDRLVDRAIVAGIDGYTFLDGGRDWVVSGQLTGSWISGAPTALLRQQESSRRYYQRPDAGYVHRDPSLTSMAGWSGTIGLRSNNGPFTVSGDVWATSPGFEANDLGFQSHADVIGATTGFTWRKLAPDRLTRERKLEVSKVFGWDFGHRTQRDSWTVSGHGLLRNYWELYGGETWRREVYDDSLTRGGPIARAPGGTSSYLGIASDKRNRLAVGSEWTGKHDSAGGWEQTIYLHVTARPSSFLTVSFGPSFSRSSVVAQYIDTIADSTATTTFGARYVFADIGQTNLGLTTRLNASLTPTLSLQLYGEPFFGVGHYGGFKELARAGTFDFLRYGQDRGTIAYNTTTQTYTIDPDGPRLSVPFNITNPDFNAKSLVAKAVLRWQWRPGSTLYVAWTQQRSDHSYAGEFDFGRDARALLRARGDDVFLAKLSYWFGR